MAVEPFPSSQLSEAASQHSSASQPPPAQKVKRPAKLLPYELRQHVMTYIEEELYNQAFLLLQNLLIAGTDNTTHGGRPLPAYIPQTRILALAATLTVHPSLTTRASSQDALNAANSALHYLHHITTLVGPTSANLPQAFRFSSTAQTARPERRRARAAHQQQDNEGTEDDSDEGGAALKNKYAAERALWTCAEDFWAVVGWAFNCSVRYPGRWARWKLWLSFMLDVLDADLDEKSRFAGEAEEAGDVEGGDGIMETSLLAQYLASVGEGRTGKRRVMRAILADGEVKSLNEFPEVWKGETRARKLPKEDEVVTQRKRLDINEGDYGDYMDVDDEDEDEEDDVAAGAGASDRSTTPSQPAPPLRVSTRNRTRPSAPPPSDHAQDDTPSDFGGLDSLLLRQRLMALLTKLSALHPASFLETEDLCDLFTEFLRPLPLSIFTQFVLPTRLWLPVHAQASLAQNLLRPLISSDAPRPKALSMGQEELMQYFLPWPANYFSYVENARVSVLVESLLRLLVRYLGVEVTGELREYLETGIEAREKKAGLGGKKMVGVRKVEEEWARGVLEMSALRMRCLIDAVADEEGE